MFICDGIINKPAMNTMPRFYMHVFNDNILGISTLLYFAVTTRTNLLTFKEV